MELVFVCPENQTVIKTADYEITDNKGVCTDADGRKFMDAKVVMTAPCPSCGRKHRYHVSELACPFGG